MGKEKIICGTEKDIARELGDRNCTFDPDYKPGLDRQGNPICKEEGMYAGDPAKKVAAEAAALAAAAKEVSQT